MRERRHGRVNGAKRMAASILTMTALSAALLGCTGPAPEPLTRVLVIGDEKSAQEGWPSALERRTDHLSIETDSLGGTGYLTASPDAVGDRVRGAHAEVIVLALGAADVQAGAPEPIRQAAVQQALAASTAVADRVVVLSPLVPGSPAGEWSRMLSEASAAAGAMFVTVPVDATTAAGPLSPEQEEQVAERVAQVLSK